MTPVDATITLEPCFAWMKFADRVDRVGDRFTFRDRTGHIHGEYEKGNIYSTAPDRAIGAVKIGDRWHWALQDDQ